MSEWKKVEEELPDFDVPVWGKVGDEMLLLERCDLGGEEGWLFGRVYDIPFQSGGRWASDCCDVDDEYLPTHWMYLPEFPK
jgi:hypothetical protein